MCSVFPLFCQPVVLEGNNPIAYRHLYAYQLTGRLYERVKRRLFLGKNGAGDETRTHDSHLGKVIFKKIIFISFAQHNVTFWCFFASIAYQNAYHLLVGV